MKLDYARMMVRLASQYADKPAIENIERDRTFTYREYHLLTNRIANALNGPLGVGRGDVYLNILNNDSLSLLHKSTVLKALGTCAWTNYRDSLEEHLWQVDLVEAKVVFVENDLLASHFAPLRERGVEVVCMDPPETAQKGLHSFWDLVDQVEETNPATEHDYDEDIVLLRFTGGTTGRGKCAAYAPRQILACRDSFETVRDLNFGPQTRFLHLAPLSHGTGMMTLATLFQGGCNVTQNSPDLEAFAKNIQDRKITSTFCVPTILYRLLEMDAPARFDLSTLETVLYGAAPMSPDRLGDLQSAFGNIFIQLYAATEHYVIVSVLSLDDHMGENSEELAERLTSCGRPTPRVEFKVVDDSGTEVANNEVGEFWHRSDGIIRSYFNNPEGTAAEFEDGWWKSGDLGFLDDDGYAHIVDRKKDMIITGGFNVYAVEVEAALNAHSSVLMSAVVGVPSEEWGEAVHAEIVAREGVTVDEAELVEFVKDRIGRHKAPKSIVVVDELPVSAVGKVLRRVVRDRYWQESDRRVN